MTGAELLATRVMSSLEMKKKDNYDAVGMKRDPVTSHCIG